MKLEELEKHLSINNPNGCGYVNIECQNKCGESILRKDLTDHYDNNCRERQINCTYCNEAGPYSYITNVQDGGHVQECQQYVDCPRKCGTTQHLKREDLEGHKEECPLQPMECPFHKAGCKQQLVRKDLESHIQSSTQQHLLNLMDAHKSLETAHKKLKLEHEELQKSDYKIKSTIASVVSEVDNIQKTVQDKTLVRSLEEITTKLNEVAPFLTKTGDKISFKFPCGSLEWDSPTVCIGDSFQLSFKLNFNNTISIVVVGSRMNGEGYIYNVKVEVKCEQRTKKQLPECHCQHKTHEFLICKLGVAIQETMLMPTDYKRGYYETCIVTLTLKRRFLFGVDQKLVDLY